MASSQRTVDYLVEQMAAAGDISARKMFGEYGLYCDGKIVALVCNEQLFVKPTPSGRAFIGNPEEAPPYQGAKPSFRIDADRWDDGEWLSELIAVSAAELPVPKPKKPKNPDPAAKTGLHGPDPLLEARVMLALEIDIDAPWPPETDWADLAERALEALVEEAPELANPRLSASLLFTSDAEVHVLNREWRAKDKPTNVLSFPMLERADLLALAQDGPPELLGDIALAHETCAREAADKGVPVADHAAHLIIHGLLHLAGHDHELSTADAEAMEALETKALARMGLANPYEPLSDF